MTNLRRGVCTRLATSSNHTHASIPLIVILSTLSRPSGGGRTPNVNAGKRREDPFAPPTLLLAVSQGVYPYSGQRQPPPNRGPHAVPSSSRIRRSMHPTCTQPCLDRVGLIVHVQRSIHQREGARPLPLPLRLFVPNIQRYPHLLMGAGWRTVPPHRYHPHQQ